MPNATTKALMAQTKFTPDSKSTYQRNLTDFVGAKADAGNEGTAAMQLARSLGVLGDTFAAAGVQKEKDKEKVGIAQAEKVMAGATEQDIKTKTAIDLLSTYGGFDTNDNPYARVLIEKARGKYIRAKARQDYEAEVVQKSGYDGVKDSQNEVTRFEDYMNKKFAEVKDISDPEAFKLGFYDNHMVEKASVANNFLKWKSDNDTATRKASTEASLAALSNNGNVLSKEDLVAQGNEILSSSIMQSAPRDERILQASVWAKELGLKTGDMAKVRHVLDNVVVYYDDDGKPVMLNKVANVQDVTNAVVRRKGEMFDKDMQDAQKVLLAGSTEKVNEWFEQKKVSKTETDRALYDAMLPFRDNIIAAIQKREEKALLQKNRRDASSAADGKALRYLDGIWSAWQSGGNTHDLLTGKRLPMSFDELEKFDYDWYDESNNLTKKKYDWDKGVVADWMDRKLASIRSNQNLSDDDKVAQTVRLLTFPPAKFYAANFKNAFSDAFTSVSVDNLDTKTTGGMKYSEQLKVAMKFYQADRHAFLELFGENNAKQAATLQILSEGKGDLASAVGLYAAGRDKMADPDFAHRTKTEVGRIVDSTPMRGFTTLSGELTNLDVNLNQNSFLRNQIQEVAEYLAASGRDYSEAVQLAKDSIAKHVYVYRNTAVPNSIFNGIAAGTTGDQARLGGQILDEVVNEHKAKTHVSSDSAVTVHWNPDRRSFVVAGGPGGSDGFTVITLEELTRRANDRIAAAVAQEKKANAYAGGHADEGPKQTVLFEKPSDVPNWKY